MGKVVKAKKGNYGGIITAYAVNLVRVGTSIYSYDDLLETYTFADGRPCGVSVEN